MVKALTQLIVVFGIPKVIQSDQDSNFTSRMLSEILQQLHIKENKASATARRLRMFPSNIETDQTLIVWSWNVTGRKGCRGSRWQPEKWFRRALVLALMIWCLVIRYGVP